MKDKDIIKKMSAWRLRMHEIIFEAETPEGKLFDIVLIAFILLSIVVVLLDSVAHIKLQHGDLLNVLEWFFTVVFTIEYLCRLACIGRPVRYAISFYGIVDLLAILPTYLSLIFPETQYLMVIRILRVQRIFRVLKLVQYFQELRLLMQALRNSRKKIIVFMISILMVAVVVGSLMYIIEGRAEGNFTSIPRSIYWAIVTMTTVGYGDISPTTSLGQALAAVLMILGYSIIVVPGGLVTAELYRSSKTIISTQACPQCSAEGHDFDAKFCKYCGAKL